MLSDDDLDDIRSSLVARRRSPVAAFVVLAVVTGPVYGFGAGRWWPELPWLVLAGVGFVLVVAASVAARIRGKEE